jgi:hypothetical protein
MRNPKLLSLLRQGCLVKFPSGILFHGWPTSNMLHTSIYDLDNHRLESNWYDLNEKGLESALKDEEEYAESINNDKEFVLQERKEEMG